MGNSIGSAAIHLSTDASKLYSGLDQVGSKIKNKTQAIEKDVSKAAAPKGGGGLGGAAMMMGGLKVAAIAAVAAATVKAVTSFAELADNIAKSKHQAAALGMSAQQLQGLQAAARLGGASTEDLAGGMRDLAKNASEATTGNADLAKTFWKIGINAQELKNLSVDEQMMKMADALQGVSNPADRAAIAMKLMGDGGMKLLPMLEQGSAGMKGMIDEAKKMGMALSDVDTANISAAMASLTKLRMIGEGLFNKLLAAAAPAVEIIGNKLSQAFETLMPIIQLGLDIYSTYWEVAAELFATVVDYVMEVINSIKGWLTEIGVLGNTTQEVREVVLQALKAIAIGFGYVWDTVKAGIGVVAIVVSYIIDGFKLVVDGFKSIVSLAKELPAHMRPDWLDGFIGGVDRFAAGIDDAATKTRKWGKDQVKAWGTSQMEIEKWFERFNKPKKDIKKPQKPTGDTQSAIGYTAIAAMEKGSKEAYSVEARFRFSNMMKSEQEKVEKQQLDQLKKIADAVRNGITKLVPF
jgi:hypothetical protein